ncbi:hypothetical protein HMPREF9008_02328 [Parabacteroides sp. 20_3]|nr:hypothetical protein HMPREF9008_02328 [Parabacteroides sp. 20_3]
MRQNSAINKRGFNNSLRDSRKIFFESDSVTRTTGATSCRIAENGTHSRRLRYLCGKSLNVLVYGNRIYREKDLRDDAGVIQRPLGKSRRPQAQKRRRAAGKVAHGRGGLRAVENQPAHVADLARQAAYRLLADKPQVLLQAGRSQETDSAYRHDLSRWKMTLFLLTT